MAEDTAPDRTVEAAQRELVDSRARYMLRNEVTTNVLCANPIMQAVHNGTKASPIERCVHPSLTYTSFASMHLNPPRHLDSRVHHFATVATDWKSEIYCPYSPLETRRRLP